MPSSNEHHDIVEEDVPGQTIAVPDAGDTGEGGKLKMLVQLLKKCLGVKDIATMRLSLPASLLEPVPNLEFSHYLDRPDIFAAINDSGDPFERMLAVLRFTFTKDLKYIHGKVVKPYNSVLGEHFRAHWDVPPVAYSSDNSKSLVPIVYTTSPSTTSMTYPTDVASVKSEKSGKSGRSTFSGISAFSKGKASTPTTSPPSSLEANVTAQMSNLSLGADSPDGERLRVVYLTEQISHHPPVSAYYGSCPKKHVEIAGIDHIYARVAGTSVKVGPGEQNRGIFINITGGHGEGERYLITHPVASVNGILRGNIYVTVTETTIITCTGGKPGTKFRTILEYKEESWLGRAHYLVEGVIHTVREGEAEHEEWTKVKHVPNNRIVAVFDGTWRGEIRLRRVGAGSYPNVVSSSASSPAPSHEHLPIPNIPAHAASRVDVSHPDSDYTTLIDLATLRVVPKEVRPLEKQLPRESRKLWENVTSHLLRKEYSEATKHKHAIEQKQRDEAAERKRKGTEHIPSYFEKDISAGYPTLTEEGWKAVQEELAERSSY